MGLFTKTAWCSHGELEWSRSTDFVLAHSVSSKLFIEIAKELASAMVAILPPTYQGYRYEHPFAWMHETASYSARQELP